MKRIALLILALCVVAAVAAEQVKVRPVPAELPAVKRSGETVVAESWDWAKEMIPVARRFTGKEGMIVCMGDSLTYANQSTRWARSVSWSKSGGYTESDQAVLRWSHAYDGQKPTNGWHLAAVDRPSGRSETAASGIRTDQYIKGGFHRLPSLNAILSKHNPQVAFILLGTNDAARGRSPDAVLKDMNTIVETCLAKGTIPVLTTLPPCAGAKMAERVKQINKRYLSLAAARKLPIIDLYGEMVSRQRGGKWKGTLVGGDGIHLTHALSAGPPTKENLANCGYLLRCWLTVQKLKQIKAKVVDVAKK